MSRWRRRLAIGFLVVAALLLLLLAGLQTPWARRQAIRQVVSALEGQGIHATFGSIGYNPLTLRVSAGEVRLAPIDTPSAPFFAARRIDAQVPWALLRGELRITSLEVDGGRLTLARGDDGRWNLPPSRESAPRTEPFILPIGRLRLSDFGVTVEDPDGGLRVRLDGLDVTLDPRGDGTIAGPLAIQGPLEIETAGRTLAARNVAGTLAYDGRHVQLAPLTLEVIRADGTPMTTARVEGRLADVYGDLAAELGIEGRADGAVAARWLELGEPVEGDVDWTARLEGAIADLEVPFTARSDALAFGALAPARLDVAGKYTSDAVTLDRIEAALLGGRAEGRARIALGEEGRAAASLTWHDLPVDALSRLVEPRGYQVAAATTGEFEGEWQSADWRTFEARAAVRFTPRPGRGVPISGRASLDAGNRRYALASSLEVGGHTRADVRLGGGLAQRWSDAGLAGETRVETTDIASLVSAIRATGAADVELPGGLSGPLVVAGRVEGQMARPVLVATAEAPALTLGTPDATGALVASVRADTSVLDAEVRSLVLAGNQTEGHVTVRFTNRALEGRFETTVTDLGALAGPFVPALDGMAVAGAGRVVTTIAGTLSRPVVDNDVALSGVALAGQAPAVVGGRVGLDGTAVVLDRVEIRRPEGDLVRLDGRYDWARDALDLRGSVDAWSLAPIALSAEGAPVPVRGTVDTLRVELAGPLETLGGSLTLNARDLAYGGLALGTAGLDARFDGGRGVVAVTMRELGGVVEGNLSLAGERPFFANVRLDQDDVRRLLPIEDPRLDLLSLGIEMNAVVQGRLGDVENLVATAEVTRLDGHLDRTAVALASPARFTYAERRAQAEAFDLQYGSTRVRLSGALGEALDGVQLRVTGNLADFESAIRLAGMTAPFALFGGFTLSLDAAGPMAAPDIRASLAIENAQASVNNLPPAFDIQVAAAYEEGVLAVETLRGQWQDSTLQASARIPARIAAEHLPASYVASLPPLTSAATIDASFDPLTPRALEPVLSGNVLDALRGVVSGRLHLETEAAALEAWRGELQLDRLALSVANVPLEQTRPTRVELAGGRVRIRDLEWAGEGNRLTAVGAIALTGADTPRFDLAVDGEGDLRVPGAFFPGISTGGRARASLSVSGPVSMPRLDGLVTVTSAEVRLREPRLAVTELNGNIVLVGDRVQFDNLRGTLNGGRLDVGGELTLAGFDIGTAGITVTARGVAMEYPEGFRSELRASVSLTKRAGEPTALLGGKVVVLRGAYRAPLSLLSFTQGGRAIVQGLAGEEPSALERTRLNITIRSVEDLIVDNNYGRFEAGLDLRLTGTVHEPALAGRLALREGGEVYLAGTTYNLEPSTVDFVDPTRIVPELGIVARTRVGGRDIRLNVTGPPDNLSLDLTSEDEDLGRADLASLLLTGRTMEQTTGAEADAAGALALSLLSGEVLGSAGRAFGLDSVRLTRGDVIDDDFRLDPTLIFEETDPASRLTISKSINGVVDVIVSQNLKDSGRLTWIVSARTIARIELRVVSADDNDRTYEIRQDLEFGGPSPAARRARAQQRARARGQRGEMEVGEVAVEATPSADRPALTARLRLEPGDTFDFFEWQDDRDRLLELYRNQGYLEARVDASRETVRPGDGERLVNLRYEVTRGPRTEVRVEGHPVPESVVGRIREEWADAVYDGFLLDDATRIVREHIASEGYLRGTVEARVDGGADAPVKTLVVAVSPGPLSTERHIEFRGRATLDEGELTDALDLADLETRAFVAPAEAAEIVRRTYQLRGYLDAKVEAQALEFAGDRAVLPLMIEEGVRYESSAIRFEGVSAVPETELAEAANWEAGRPFESEPFLLARGRVERYYRQRGYNNALVTPRIDLDREGGVAQVTFNITEGPRQVITDIVVVGGDNTSRRLIRRALDFQSGDPANLEKIYRARKQLYDTGVFQRADVEVVPPGTAEAREAAAEARAARLQARVARPVSETPPGAPETTPPGTGAPGVVTAGATSPEAPRVIEDGVEKVEALVTLVERRPWRFRWGFLVTDVYDEFNEKRRQRPGVTADIQYRNLFGQAVTTGVAVRASRDYQAGRAFITAPRLFRRNIRSSVYLTRSHEDFGVEGLPLEIDRTILSLEQRVRPRPALEFSWGASYERTDFLNEFIPGFAFGGILDVIKAQALGLYDRRDNPFDATRGWFHASAVEYGITRSGGDQRFLKFSTQQFHYWTVADRVVLATAVRGGVATGFGDDLIVTERFLLGGGNTVRGYPEESLGPRDEFGRVAGGEAVLAFNQEVRFPVWKWLRGVAFVDAGNVFRRPDDFDVGNLKVGAGLGARLHTPWVVLRLDFGLPVSDSTDLSRGRWIFSLGQAF
ncbi:MAG: translocation/assembly module TamB domain-containing protein [Vicinamibacteraceae bacterium]|nr:translocation/assembly module TamB domain-containing protein [Vicinamibacteraceae bacterium]